MNILDRIQGFFCNDAALSMKKLPYQNTLKI